MKLKNKKYKSIDYINIPFKSTPVPVIIILILQVLTAVIPNLLVIATALFIDTSIDIFKNGGIHRIYSPLFLIMMLVSFSWVSSILSSFANLKLELKLNENIRLILIKKRSSLAYQHIENNETWDLISRVGEDPSKQLMDGFHNILSIVSYIVQIMGLIFIIAIQIWWIAIIILIVAIPLFILAFRSGNLDYEAFSEAQKYIRKAKYIREILSSRENVEERTLFGYTNSLNKIWLKWFETARLIEYKANKKNFIRMKTASIITTFLSMIIAFILLTPVYNEIITVGMYMGLVTAAFNLVQKMSWELSVVMQNYTKNNLYLKDLTAFLNLEEVSGADSLPDVSIRKMKFNSIEFKNVYFTYPGTDKEILKGLSMRLEKNKQYAFVGKNGAGKTTITKLMTGLYDNYKGEILINDENIKNLTHTQLKAYFSVVYQDFAKFQISLKDNILLGSCGENNYDSFKESILIENVLDNVDLSDLVTSLPRGIDTQLGKLSEEGIDLSGGQWQRIAIARNLVSNAPVHILDEPTASIDPISESKLYKLFSKVTKGKSTILITHRLGAARIADEILVVDEGIIAERGNHEELLRKNGIYTEMFEGQRGWYNEQKA